MMSRKKIVRLIERQLGKYEVFSEEWDVLSDLLALIEDGKETKPCLYCYTEVIKSVWKEELGMCINCSDDFFSHKIDPYNPDTFPRNRRKKEKDV